MKFMKSRRRILWLVLSITGLIILSSIIYFNFIRQPQETEDFGPWFPYCSDPVDSQWIARVNHIKWVAYSSPNPNTEPGFFQPSPETIRKDLLTLKKAGFTGLVTYSSFGVMGKDFPYIADELGFDGIIMGVWDPGNQSEFKNAIEAARLPGVVGFSIGNEGLYRDSGDRYTIPELCETIMSLRASTGKPVTTSEETDDFEDHPFLFYVGDWVFANAHPYWHMTKNAERAVRWEVKKYKELSKHSHRFVFFREVGLPTLGAFGLSETNHDLFYRELAGTDVRFVYFEGFDQPSKDHNSVEPNWGLFRFDQSPKLAAWNLMGVRPFTSSGPYDGWILECTESSNSACSLDKTGPTLIVGDDAQRRQYRSILSFNTSGLPDDVVVTSVELKVKTAEIVGSDPFEKHAHLLVDVCTPSVGIALIVQLPDFGVERNCRKVGLFGTRARDGWYTAELDPAVVNLQGMTQFRLRFEKDDDNDRTADYLEFFSGNAEDSLRPSLVIEYNLP
jgi:exo-beta-1,3-glucanase (GH17 family)